MDAFWDPPSSSLDHSEAALIAAAQRGVIAAFESLYRQHCGAVHGLCLRLTGRRDVAEDCTQETFIAAWRALPRFDARCGLGTWLHRIAVNAVLSRRRSVVLRREASDADLPEPATPERDVSIPMDLERAVLALPPGARDALVLVAIYGYTHSEAASLLGIAEGTCKAQLHRARQLLLDYCEEDKR